jgi:DNA-binding PadR family transcriptional regulator
VLSILALRDHSTYDIARQMEISMHYMWPRAESNVYAEPKRLVAAGLATAREEWQGSRRRTVYSITDGGRDALGLWLAAPSTRSRFESEALVKIFFAENGTVKDMLAAIRHLGEESAALVSLYLDIADRYERGGGDYPERFALSGLSARLLMDHAATTVRWAKWAEQVVSQWDSPLAGATSWGIETIRSVRSGD